MAGKDLVESFDIRVAQLQRFPFQAAAKFCLGKLGVRVREDVRRPLRPLLPTEKTALEEWLESS